MFKLYVFFTLFTFCFCIKGLAQVNNANIEFSQVFSSFSYIDSKGVKDKTYTYRVSNAYSFGIQHINSTGLFVRANIGMRKAGSGLTFNKITYNWNLQYLDVKAGIGYKFIKWRLRPYFSLSPYYAYLLNASQTINSDSYDIKSNKSIKSSDIGVYITGGLNIILSNYVSLYAEYNYIRGLYNIEPAQKERLYNYASSLNLGVSFNITKISKLNQPRMLK